MSVAPELTEENGAEAKKRTDREVDAAGEDDGSHDESQEADFDGVSEDVPSIVTIGEMGSDGVEV